ncbi:MAG: N-acetylmuramoyl-L-alanine amidase, partial [Deltaproteobacteria bacterium]|nr:N-acetylmuramoyl-L-alanine amidase [Deltaproteobacteria bacterium]
MSAGCAQPYELPQESALDPDDQEETVSRGDLAEQWTPNGEWLVSPLLAAPAGATRVGVLIEVGASDGMPRVEARLISGANPSTTWSPLATTWSEAGNHVAVIDFPVQGDSAQLRLAIEAVDRVRHLSWSAVLPAGEDEFASDEGYGTRREALRAELGGMGIVTREAWGASATRCSSTDSKSKMAIHYTVTPSDNPAARVRSIQHYHMDTKGWCDIGYHFLVGTDGSIYEGRPLQMVGAHVGGHNTGNIGVSFIGCFHPSGCSGMGPTTPPGAMIEAGGRLL